MIRLLEERIPMKAYKETITGKRAQRIILKYLFYANGFLTFMKLNFYDTMKKMVYH